MGGEGKVKYSVWFSCVVCEGGLGRVWAGRGGTECGVLLCSR